MHATYCGATILIEPTQSLAFSIQSSPGVYALLLGSGVSRAANIPTGWEVTLDLTRQLAASTGANSDPDPVSWYRGQFEREPEYSELLEALAKTPAERQQLLRGYFESPEQPSGNADKQPTEAHRAIATLVAEGYIRVIVTTNFDRLLETALTEKNVAPTVLSSVDQIRGAVPLIHMPCCILKLHGDYLDSRILNTEEELAGYPEEQNQLLDRIFDEFGLIVCGWSGDWDEALRSAIQRTASRRYSTYWAAHGELTDTARSLIAHRRAEIIAIDGADAFFGGLCERVIAIERYRRPDPDSIETAVSRLKEYLPEPKHRIRLSDLVDRTVEKVMEQLSAGPFSVDQPRSIASDEVNDRIQAYESAAAPLLHLAAVGGRWAEEAHFTVWRRALQRLGARRAQGGIVFWLEMQRYPETLLLYTFGLGAIAGDRLAFLNHLLCTTVRGDTNDDPPAVQVLPPLRLFSRGTEPMQVLEGMERRRFPLNDWIHDALQPIVKSVLPDRRTYTVAFDKLEILIALAFAYRGSPFIEGWMPVGAFQYRHDNRIQILKEIRDSFANHGSSSPFVEARIFGGTVDECEVVARQSG